MDDDPTRILIRHVFSAIAQYDKDITVEKLRLARLKKRETTGRCEGRKGYRDSEHGLDILRMVRRLRRNQRGMKRLSYREISERLNGMGIRTLDGREFTTSNVKRLLK